MQKSIGTSRVTLPGALVSLLFMYSDLCTSQAVCIGEDATGVVEAEAETEALISELRDLDHPMIGLTDIWSHSTFVLDAVPPTQLSDNLEALNDVPAPPKAFTLLVRQGLTALPMLLRHLDDCRQTKVVFASHQFEQDSSETDVRVVDWRAAEISVQCRLGILDGATYEGNPGDLRFEYRPDNKRLRNVASYRPTVGDLCYIAIGQIVNRNFVVVDYEPENRWQIYSPTECKQLCDFVRLRYEGLTEQAHRRMLECEALGEPRRWSTELPLCASAVKRLSIYYPDAAQTVLCSLMGRHLYDEEAVWKNMNDVGLVNSDSDEWVNHWNVYRAGRPYVDAVGAVRLLQEQTEASHMICFQLLAAASTEDDWRGVSDCYRTHERDRMALEYALADIGGETALQSTATIALQLEIVRNLGNEGLRCLGSSVIELLRACVTLYGSAAPETGAVMEIVERLSDLDDFQFSQAQNEQIESLLK